MSLLAISISDYGHEIALSWADPQFRLALLAAVVLGVNCGILGCFLVLRRIAMLGDTISHAILPGIVVAFAFQQQQNFWVLLTIALATGLLAAWMVDTLEHTTPTKSETALSVTLSLSFALGVFGISLLQNQPGIALAGVESYLFGQFAAINEVQLLALGVALCLTLTFLAIFYRPLAVSTFDPVFAETIGIPIHWLRRGFIFLTTIGIVTSAQSIGVILAAAVLILPAASSLLLSNSLLLMLGISALIGTLQTVLGCIVSYHYAGVPTGPSIIVIGAVLFAFTLFFAPHKGILIRSVRRRQQSEAIAKENLVKDIYRLSQKDSNTPINATTLAGYRQLPEETILHIISKAKRMQWLETREDNSLLLTAKGRQRAIELVRNHRLWETFLATKINIATDHVHRDAEDIEHIIDPYLAQRLFDELEQPELDPHGSPIPHPPNKEADDLL